MPNGPFFMALGRVMSACRMGRVRRMGTSEKVSTPPTRTRLALSQRIFSAGRRNGGREGGREGGKEGQRSDGDVERSLHTSYKQQ